MKKEQSKIKVANQKMIQEMILDRLGKYCPKCGAVRTEKNIAILGQQQDTFIIHIGCLPCGAQDVFHFVANVGYRSAGGLVTDVSSTEAPKFFKSSTVSRDDILDVHLLVKETDTAKDLLKKLSTRRSPKRVKVMHGIPPMSPSVTSYKG